jgi:hypothetical protein
MSVRRRGSDTGCRQGGQDRVAAQDRDDDDHRDQGDGEDDEVVADLQDGPLEVAHGVRARHELRGPAEVGVRAGAVGPGRQGADLALADDRAGVDGVARRAGGVSGACGRVTPTV